MTRDIKFRGITDDGKMIYGFFSKCGKYYHIDWEDPVTEQWSSVKIKPETLGQYIGRKDSKGIEMFEGDTVDCEMSYAGGSLPHRGEIVYLEQFGAFATKNDSGETLLHNHCLNTFEVIGNIHQPEPKEPCTHEGYNFKDHGRCCPHCSEFLTDFGD